MQSTGTQSSSLLIIPCSCDSYLGRLTAAAAQSLLQSNSTARRIALYHPDAPDLLQHILKPEISVIAVDGCNDSCVKKKLAKRRITVEFSLNLTELALTDRNTSEIASEDLQLAVDGIIASAVRTTDFFPRIPGCCCR